VRLAVELFVVERMSAADVARTVGWPNSKAVYNRVYRALATLKARLESEGIGPGDL
jgi:DNA-directed RNA polymerase specialized sigma24 family protein